MDIEQLGSLFEEFLRIYKLVNRKIIIDLLTTELNTSQLLKLYELTDGEKPTREIASLLGNISHVTVANIWKRWAIIGIVIPAERKGRYKAAFNLSEYGIISVENE
ncbi:MAG: hypothetical protein QM657_03105 [Lacrimispora sp.]|uniref:hypothetical protein n=1 Tax=Lacrimispora sp. TaxID=2719234 RepID=UPI0039E4D1F7